MRIELHNFLFALARALDYVEAELFGIGTGHSHRVALICVRVARHMGMDDEAVFDMASCAVLHDNGLTEYTLQQGLAAAHRREHLELHCISGEHNARHFPFRRDVADIVLQHHENWDGSGIFRRKGTEIAQGAAILRLADNADLHLRLNAGDASALRQKTHSHVRKHCGKVYAPDVADAFLDICDEELLLSLRNEAVEDALVRHIPPLRVLLTPESLVHACGIFSAIVDNKSPFTAHHSRGLAVKAAHVGRYLGLERAHALRLEAAAALHDVGKLLVPAEILEKQGSLTPEEFSTIREHARGTMELLEPVRGMEELAFWAYTHHEKLNGKGYPLGLSAAELPFESRLLACLDIYQALVEDRPYRRRLSHAKALSILRGMARNGELDTVAIDHVDKAFADAPLA